MTNRDGNIPRTSLKIPMPAGAAPPPIDGREGMTTDERALLLENAKIMYAQGMGARPGELSGKPLLAAIQKLDPTYDYVRPPEPRQFSVGGGTPEPRQFSVGGGTPEPRQFSVGGGTPGFLSLIFGR